MKITKVAIGALALSILMSVSEKTEAKIIQEKTFYGVGINAEMLSYMHKTNMKTTKKNNNLVLYTNCSAKLRSEKSKQAKVLDIIPINTKVYSLRKEENWDYVQVGKDKGYIYSQLLSSSPEERVSLKQNRWGIALSKDEKGTLAKIIWIEARGEGIEGQKAVVEVILNRIVDEDFPDSLWGVVSQPTHFSSFPLINTAYPEQEQYQIIEDVLCGKSNILSMDTVYFSTSPRNSNIKAHIGGHYFCGK